MTIAERMEQQRDETRNDGQIVGTEFDYRKCPNPECASKQVRLDDHDYVEGLVLYYYCRDCNAKWTVIPAYGQITEYEGK